VLGQRARRRAALVGSCKSGNAVRTQPPRDVSQTAWSCACRMTRAPVLADLGVKPSQVLRCGRVREIP